MFTGDRSGDFLYRALWESGFANQPESRSVDDGLRLTDVRVLAAGHCAPPDNKPTPEELKNCRPWLERELELLTGVRVVVVLGRIAFDTYLGVMKAQGKIARRSDFEFGHGRVHELGRGLPVLICSYHPSQQNTSTGRLTLGMLTEVFHRARGLLKSQAR
jgi:uracil-DNA glycosylase